MTGLRDLEAAAERVAVNRGDERLARVLHPPQERVCAGRSRKRIGFRLERVEDLDVGARDERRARANQHDRIHVAIRDRALHRLIDPLPYRGAERVDRRVVDRDHRGTIGDVVVHESHAVSWGQISIFSFS